MANSFQGGYFGNQPQSFNAGGMTATYGQPIQQQPIPQFVGRFVNNLTDILPNEVPMDGRPGIFPNSDLSEIFLKIWGSDGSIKSFRYILDTTVDLNAAQNSAGGPGYNQLAARIESLEQQIQSNAKKRSSSNQKDEVK